MSIPCETCKTCKNWGRRSTHTDAQMKARHHKDCPEGNKKKPILKLCPELADGSSWTVCDNERGLIESVKSWYDEFKGEVGEEIKIEVIEMSDNEVDTLPEL